MDYEKPYHIMFNAATDAAELLQTAQAAARQTKSPEDLRIERARVLLAEAQRICEELYIADAESAL
ncbi:MAG: hypothetical protein LBT36_03480 [Oscillospiraceae bacterium]|jgi:hypothetical protein|nr:hypothetical protein [Oscillospiraceae bacterium]